MFKMIIKTGIIISIIISLLSVTVNADTPANCTYEDSIGIWSFYEGARGFDKTIACNSKSNLTHTYEMKLTFPDVAIDINGNVGFWTLIYNQGFEVVINGRKYFAFFSYSNNESFCDHTLIGTSHSVGVNAADWSCFFANKKTQKTPPKQKLSTNKQLEDVQEHTFYKTNNNFIDDINSVQSLWTARKYDFMDQMTIMDVIRRAGGKNSRGYKSPKPSTKKSETISLEASALPDQFDWRNVGGVSYVSPIRNQGSCGSCYTFGSMAMLEARLRIMSFNRNQTIYSTQDIVECSPYSQGCDGGFPYLIAGKYAEDYGVVADACNPYKGVDGTCHTDVSCARDYATHYTYIGGFYGACNEDLMKIAIVRNGPIAVSFEVYPDFMNYAGGIYVHTGLKDNLNFAFNPFELTNHVVAIVGYGEENGVKYWTVKNSWGASWGEQGFFRIRRGTDECAIESIAVESFPLVR